MERLGDPSHHAAPSYRGGETPAELHSGHSRMVWRALPYLYFNITRLIRRESVLLGEEVHP